MIERAVAIGLFVAVFFLIGSVVQRRAAQRRMEIVTEQRLAANEAGLPQILSFYGPGCEACVVQERILATLRTELDGALAVRHLDAVNEPDLAMSLGVRIVPTTVVAMPDGRISGINSGIAGVDELRAQLRLLA